MNKYKMDQVSAMDLWEVIWELACPQALLVAIAFLLVLYLIIKVKHVLQTEVRGKSLK